MKTSRKMAKPKLIEVTQKDINKAERERKKREEEHLCLSIGTWCPVANAIKRTLKTKLVWVSGEAIEIGRRTNSISDYTLYKVPNKIAENIIERFDNYEKVKPASFALRKIKRL